MSFDYVMSYGHAVVGFEYFGGSEPGILRVVLGELSLVVIVTEHLLKIEGSSHLSYLKICMNETAPGLQKYPCVGWYKRS